MFFIIVLTLIVQTNAFFEKQLDCSAEISEEQEIINHLEMILNHSQVIGAAELIEQAQEMIQECQVKIDGYRYAETFTNRDVRLLGVMCYGESVGSPTMESAATVWCALNRLAINYGDEDTIEGIITAPGQFEGYRWYKSCPQHYFDLAKDVLIRWCLEQKGTADVGRVLPEDYLYFYGDGRHNHFKTQDGIEWDWSLDDPYAD